VHLARDGKMPWTRQNVTYNVVEEIHRLKSSTPADKLFQGYPSVFPEFLEYCKKLKFDEKPNYRLWINKFAETKFDLENKLEPLDEDLQIEFKTDLDSCDLILADRKCSELNLEKPLPEISNQIQR